MKFDNLKQLLSECELEGEKLIVKSDLAKTVKMIKDNFHFNILKDITAIDKKDEGIELIYRLFTIEDEEEVLVSITVKNEAESICSIFDSACADEKEIYDMFGIKFIGNEELKRLYMPETWNGHPLKKDYEEKDERLNWNE